MKELRKDNHYVPKLYLKQWAKLGEIPTYRLLVPNENVPHWKTQSLKGIAYHQHLYTYLAGREETDEFERWLDTEFESPAEEAIRRVCNEERLSPRHWKSLVRFAVAQDVRTPASLRKFIQVQNATLENLMNETMQKSINKMEEAVRNNETLPQCTIDNDILSLFNISITKQPDGSGHARAETIIGRRLWIWQMRHILTQTLGRLPTHKWTILHAPPGTSWPTSDNPLIRLNFQDASNYDFGGGWGVKNGDIILPLSPKHLLYTCIGKRPWLRGTTLDTKTSLLIRKIIIEHADRYIFSQEAGDIHLLRPRHVCPIACKNEDKIWRNWHTLQREAELELQLLQYN